MDLGKNLGVAGSNHIGDDEPVSAYGPLDFGDTEGANVTEVACGDAHCLALFDNGKVKSWGDAHRGQLGHGDETELFPEDGDFIDEGGGVVVAVAAGPEVSAIVYENGSVKIWGDEQVNVFANPTFFGSDLGDDESLATVPPIDLGGPVASLQLGNRMACALFKNGSARLWGEVGSGENGFGCFLLYDDFDPAAYDDPYFDQYTTDDACSYIIGDKEQVIATKYVDLDETITSLHCGDYAAALTESGAVYTWGGHRASDFELGRGDNEFVTNPQEAGPIIESGTVALAIADKSGCALLDSLSWARANVYCWGDGDFGLQGTGTSTKNRVPIRVTDTVLGTDVLQRFQSPAKVFLTVDDAATPGVVGAIVAPESHVEKIHLDSIVLANVGPTFPEAFYVDSSASLNFGSDIVDPSQCPYASVTAIGDSKACLSYLPSSNTQHLARGRLGVDVHNASSPDETLATVGGSQLDIEGDFSFASVYGIVQVFVGGRECTSPTVSPSFQTITCTAPIGVGANVSIAMDASDDVISDAPAAIFSVFRDANLTISYNPPVVDVVVPDADLDPLGGEEIRVQGSGFGSPSLSYDVNVTIDGEVCRNVEIASDAELHCTTPAGFGAARHLVVTIAGQSNEADGVTVATLPPEVTAVGPSYALAGGSENLLFQVNGTGFGADLADFEQVKIGGLECVVTEIVTPTTSFHCELNAASGWVEDQERIVRVWAGGQASPKTRGLFEGVSAISITSTVVDGSNPTTGGGIVRLIGDGFGFAASDVSGVWLNLATENVSLSYTWSEAEIRAEMPAGVGTGLTLTVASVVGVEATSSGVDYDAPVITSVSPSYGLAGSVLDDGFVVNGTGFGASVDDVTAISLGGVSCSSWTVLSVGEAVRCDVIDATSGWVSTDAARIWVAGGQSSGNIKGVFQGLSAPSISAIATIAPLSTGGGGQVVVAADGLGRNEEDLEGVFVGSAFIPQSSSDIVWGELQMTVNIPAGVGNQPLWFVNKYGATSSKLDTITYSAPTITSVTPSYALQGATAQELTICGTNFPPTSSLAANTSAPLGGHPCANITYLNSSCLHCGILPTTPWPLSTSSEVIVSGVSSGAIVGVFEGIDAPVVNEVDLEVVDTGDVLTLIGSNFGRSASDISSIPLGSSTCNSITYVSDTVLRCTIPTNHPDFAPTSSSIETVDLSVCNAAGACSSSSVTLQISGRGDIPVAVASPFSIDAYREIAAAGELVISWEYYTSSDEDDLVDVANSVSPNTYTTATSFYIEAFRADHISPLTTPASTASVSISGSALVATSSTARSYTTTISIFSRMPHYVRIFSVGADGGKSNASALVGPFAEACVANEYLPTHMEVEKWLCEECVHDRVICAGLHATNITALEGWWRVPWIDGAPASGFARCDVSSACLGWKETVPATTRSQNGTRGVAVPGLSLHPSDYEGCRAGHQGVLCAQCSRGYYEEVTGDCIECGNPTLSYIRFVGIALAVLLLFSAFLLRAVFNASSGSRPEVILAKILSSHLQSVTIVATANIAWSIPTRNFFNVVDGTSFSSQGISLECIMGAAGKNPVILSSLTIYALPTALLLYAAFYWFVMPYAYRACCANLVHIEPFAETGRFFRHLKISAVVLAFLLHATITKAAFGILTCRLIGPEGDENSSSFQSRLVANLDIKCDSPSTIAAIYGVAIPALVLVSLGIPLLFIAFVCRNRQRVETTAFRDVWAFAVAGYKPEFAWWEGIVQLRKFGLVAVTVWLSTSTAILQLTSAIAVITVALVLHTSIRPYHEEDHHYLELGALMTAFLTMLCGLYLSAAPDSSSTARLAITILVIGSNAGLVLAGILLVSLRIYRKSVRAKQLKAAKPTEDDDNDGVSEGAGYEFSVANPQKSEEARTPRIAVAAARSSPAPSKEADSSSKEETPDEEEGV